MGKSIRTKHGHDLFVVSSALQKAIRRNDARLACWAVWELFTSGYLAYAWRRLLVVSAEDCDGIITTEIEALYRAHQVILEKAKPGKPRGLVFLAKATLLLCRQPKNRDADHVGYLAQEGALASDQEVLALLHDVEAGLTEPIPEYVYDVHTWIGRAKGKTKAQFWTEEQAALTPKAPGLFDHLLPEVLPSDAPDDPASSPLTPKLDSSLP